MLRNTIIKRNYFCNKLLNSVLFRSHQLYRKAIEDFKLINNNCRSLIFLCAYCAFRDFHCVCFLISLTRASSLTYLIIIQLITPTTLREVVEITVPLNKHVSPTHCLFISLVTKCNPQLLFSKSLNVFYSLKARDQSSHP